MFEVLVSPRHAERNPFSLFFIGMLYSSLSLFLVNMIAKGDAVMMKHASMLLISFTTIFSIPFIHSLIRRAEISEVQEKRASKIFAGHSRALLALLFLFLGFLVAFSLWYIFLPENSVVVHFSSQIEKFCSINARSMQECLKEYGISAEFLKGTLTGNAVAGLGDLSSIFVNNLYVLLFTLIFSLAFGAGAIFILAWNASVIAAAIGLFTNAQIKQLHIGLMRYLIHGIPELVAYYIGALAGGILSIAIIRHDFKNEKFWCVLRDSVDLIVIAIVVLIIAALIEVFVTPALF